MHRCPALILAALSLWAASARAGWYEVTSYAGTIGTRAVHLSLQTFRHLPPGKAAHQRVEGSYYDDQRRTPVALTGERAADGRMVLCEATALPSGGLQPIGPSPADGCPITLYPSDDGAVGEWRTGGAPRPISLRRVGSLDDTGPATLTGVVDIPMWHHTPSHLIVGVYQASGDCAASMLRLRLINKRTGHIDHDIPLECDAGMIMTSIHSNVRRGRTGRQLIVGYLGGKMGRDELLDLGQRLPRASRLVPPLQPIQDDASCSPEVGAGDFGWMLHLPDGTTTPPVCLFAPSPDKAPRAPYVRIGGRQVPVVPQGAAGSATTMSLMWTRTERFMSQDGQTRLVLRYRLAEDSCTKVSESCCGQYYEGQLEVRHRGRSTRYPVTRWSGA